MFGDAAPIWEFLTGLGANIDPTAAVRAAAGKYAIEVFPAVATLGLFTNFYDRRRLPKYNPARGAFLLDDWQALCEAVGHLGDELGIVGGASWCQTAAALQKPRKADQDKLDALVCAVVAYRWWRRGLEGSVVVGDLTTGYIVVPTH